MSFHEHYGVVVITGASSGLGAEIAKKIAPNSKAVILVARSREKLQKLQTEIRTANPNVKVQPILCDLTVVAHRQRLIQDLSTLRIDTLILNAGSGIFKKFLEAQYTDHLKTIELNVTANVDLTYHLLPTMNPAGRIQIISSHSSEMRIPNFSIYTPAKTFLTLWAQTLAIELKASPRPSPSISIVCAGAMDTEFGSRAGIPKMVSTAAAPAVIAKKCILLLNSPGTHYLALYDRLIWALNRFLPRRLIDLLVTKTQARYIK